LLAGVFPRSEIASIVGGQTAAEKLPWQIGSSKLIVSNNAPPIDSTERISAVRFRAAKNTSQQSVCQCSDFNNRHRDRFA
jgi:hypothetical protein